MDRKFLLFAKKITCEDRVVQIELLEVFREFFQLPVWQLKLTGSARLF